MAFVWLQFWPLLCPFWPSSWCYLGVSLTRLGAEPNSQSPPQRLKWSCQPRAFLSPCSVSLIHHGNFQFPVVDRVQLGGSFIYTWVECLLFARHRLQVETLHIQWLGPCFTRKNKKKCSVVLIHTHTCTLLTPIHTETHTPCQMKKDHMIRNSGK